MNGECQYQMPPYRFVTSELPHTACHSALAVEPQRSWNTRDSQGTNCVTLRMAPLCCSCSNPTISVVLAGLVADFRVEPDR